ncbi:MAG: cysteine--tRNA ligase [Ruminococcaceae bacterium]|nr:cysteine--tRNA ligase [Oscillospiraceae bacterium]
MQVYNSLSRRKADFETIEPNKVRMYSCGITVSSDAHIGHAKQALQFDVIRRYLEYKGNEVIYVRNWTDVDDKIINAANANGVKPLDWAQTYIDRITADMTELGIRPATIEPRASETIPEIIEFVQALIDNGHAYHNTETGDVLYDIAKFNDYGHLSGAIAEQAMGNWRVGKNGEMTSGKAEDHEHDFVLWKSAKPGEISWPSPWGEGRPGWHIECSAMCYKFLGEMLDIHGGGLDLKFPHHENEIAQSEGRFGHPLANYWMHCGLVKVNGVKMSKSLGNGISIRDALNKYHPEVIKWVILGTNYRSDMNITDGIFEQAEKHLDGFHRTLQRLQEIDATLPQEPGEFAAEIRKNFEEAMDDDFNTAKVLANFFEIAQRINAALPSPKKQQQLCGVYATIKELYEILALFTTDHSEFVDALQRKYYVLRKVDKEAVEKLIAERLTFRMAKNWEEADKLKQQLLDMGIVLKDTKDGTEYSIAI